MASVTIMASVTYGKCYLKKDLNTVVGDYTNTMKTTFEINIDLN